MCKIPRYTHQMIYSSILDLLNIVSSLSDFDLDDDWDDILEDDEEWSSFCNLIKDEFHLDLNRYKITKYFNTPRFFANHIKDILDKRYGEAITGRERIGGKNEKGN